MSEDIYADAERPHEATDASPAGVLVTMGCVGLLIAAGLGGAAVSWIGHPGLRRDRPDQTFRNGPVDRPDIEREWPSLERELREHLQTYGWVDRKAGVVRIPIEQAMARLADEDAAAARGRGAGR